MSDSGKAVFLSYASQDAEAAKRICDALRAAGIEVWFDQSELVGGDQWDGKIRGQISSCALFMPVISASTQARREGYFRIEWKLAAQRTHAMADGTPFLVPIVIDDTKDTAALVPGEFKAVQWTKLFGGETPPAFAPRVKKLLGGETVGGALRPDSFEPSGHKTPPATKPSPRWLLPVIGGVVIAAIALLITRPWQDRNPPASGLPFAASPSNPPPASTAAPAAALTEAQKLVQQAQKVYAGSDELDRETLNLADDLVKRALVLDAAEPTAWLLAAQLSYTMVWQSFDKTEARKAELQRQAARARALAPESVAARLAAANARLAIAYDNYQSASNRQDLADVEKDLLALAAEQPGDFQIQRALGQTYRFLRRPDEALAALQRAVELSGGDPGITTDVVNVVLRRKRYADAEALVAPVLARRPIGRMLALDVMFKLQWRGDLPAAQAALATWPGWLLREDRGAFIAWQTWLWSRQPARALEVAQRLSRDYLRDVWFTGPRAVLTARAHELAGNREAALGDWRTAVRFADQELAAAPDDIAALFWKTWALGRLGDQAGMEAAATLLRQHMTTQTTFFKCTSSALLWATIGRADLAFDQLRTGFVTDDDAYAVTRVMLELEPAYESLRADPRFAALAAAALAPAPGKQTSDDRGQTSQGLGRATGPGSAAPRQARGLEPVETAADIGKTAAPDTKSVAVLAFANLSDDKANEYFSDGISEELLNVLAKVPQLKVAARTSSFYFKGRNEPIPEIAQKLGVAYVVEGSVRKAGNRVRVTAQLIKAADGYHVWSETYDRDLNDIFAVQDEIARNILGVVKGSLLGATELPHATTTNIEAYTLFLQAQGAFALRGEANLREAIRLYEAALKIDPDFVPALVGMAKALTVLPNYAYLNGAKARAVTEAANKAARRALELDPRNAAAHASLGWAAFQFGWQWSEGLAEVQQARDLAPNDSWNWNLLGDCHRYAGDLVQALVDKQRSWELDPLSPNSHWDLSYSYLVAGRYEEAITWSEKCIALAPHNMDSYIPAFLAQGRAGRLDRMRRMLTATRQNVHEGEGLLLLLEAYGAILEKNPVEARRLQALAEPLAEAGTGSLAILGYNYLLLGESDLAARWLQRAYERRDLTMIWSEFIDFEVIAANPKTRPILDQPYLKELHELRQRNVRAGLNKL